jgi:ferredoxin-type protein NapH
MLNTMRAIKLVGLGLFVAGFVIFNTLFFSANYVLTKSVIEDTFYDSTKASLFLLSSSSMINQKNGSVFSFVSDLKKVFDSANQNQFGVYGITQEEVLDLVARSGKKFSIASVDSLYIGADEVSVFKKKSFKDYGSWLDGREFNSPDELQNQLQSVVEKIHAYAIISQVGFDRYQVKDLTYSITKASASSPVKANPGLYLFLTFGFCIVGALLYIFPKIQFPAGIKNNGIFFNVMKNTGWLGIFTGTWLIAFYVVLYFFPEYMTNWVSMVDPISKALNGNEAGRFFLYGFIYTICILVMGVRMIIHYRHSKYQILRTTSVMFFQTAFAFLIPEILIRLNKPYFDFKNIWPLDYGFFFDSRLNELTSNGTLGLFMLGWGMALIIIAVPVFVYFFGKRWYCSWVCGCGGLAETLGDPYRQLSNKSLKAWKVERWMIHGVFAFAIVMTIGLRSMYRCWFCWSSRHRILSTHGQPCVVSLWLSSGCLSWNYPAI